MSAEAVSQATPPDQSWIRNLGPILGDHKKAMAIAVVVAILERGLFGLTPLVQRTIIDDAILSERSPIARWIVLLVGIAAVSSVIGYWRRYVGGRAAIDVQNDLQVRLHRHMQHLDAAQRDTLRTGDIMSRAASDTTLIQMFLQQLSNVAG